MNYIIVVCDWQIFLQRWSGMSRPQVHLIDWEEHAPEECKQLFDTEPTKGVTRSWY